MALMYLIDGTGSVTSPTMHLISCFSLWFLSVLLMEDVLRTRAWVSEGLIVPTSPAGYICCEDDLPLCIAAAGE